MGRVRYYSEGGESYITLRVESDGIYVENTKQRIRERRNMPPKRQAQVVQPVSNSATRMAEDTADTFTVALGDILTDFEKTLAADPKAMVVIKSRYKKPGYTVSVRYNGEWSDYDGQTALDALLQYYEDVLT